MDMQNVTSKDSSPFLRQFFLYIDALSTFIACHNLKEKDNDSADVFFAQLAGD